MKQDKSGAQSPSIWHRFLGLFPFSWRDLGLSALVLSLATVLCMLLRLLDDGDVFIALIYCLAVVLVARFTNGYLFGLLASLVSLLGINYIFTYPYLAFDFSLSGYPLTFLVMLAVSVAVSTLTTQIKRQEMVRAQAEREKMRGNLLRAVSHDIRTPLTSIVGGVNAILDSGDQLSPQTHRELLESIRQESQWLVSVVENLLSVTRISGASTIQKTPEPGEEVLASANVKFQKRLDRVAVDIQIPDDLLMIPMDPILIEQVLINLMENAVLHGKTTTQLTLRLYQAGGNAVFEVADNGQGIAREVMPKLFQGVLSQMHEEDESDGKRNMGIGLSVCQSIIQAHGGVLTGENQPGGGACFRFTLPLEENEL